MRTDRTKDRDRFGLMLKGWMEQFAHSLSSHPETKAYLHQLAIEPVLEYIFRRVFPYLIMTLCLLAAMFIVIVVILVLLLRHSSPSPGPSLSVFSL